MDWVEGMQLFSAEGCPTFEVPDTMMWLNASCYVRAPSCSEPGLNLTAPAIHTKLSPTKSIHGIM